MPGWLTSMLRNTEINLATSPGYSFETTPSLLAEFDRNVREARAALASAKDADFTVPWSLKHGAHVIMTIPRSAVVRTPINHLVHHRGRLRVYLRMNDVPPPAIDGP